MYKGINERKANNRVFLGSLGLYISIICFGMASRHYIFWLFTLSIIGIIISAFSLFYGAYSLGWEYKRISLDDTNEVDSE